jgi:hypothetical protein
MAEAGIQALESGLRSQVSKLVGKSSYLKAHPVHDVLRKIEKCDRNAVLCGGACRDMVLGRGRTVPRDLDIIVQYVSLADLEDQLGDYAMERTRYGGLTLQVRDWEIDIWPLLETWAFKHGGIAGKGLDDFTRTTFLDIDAIAIQLFTRKGCKRRIYDRGFFAAVRDRTIELNFGTNPFPSRCIVKSMLLAARHKFALGPRLVQYIRDHAKRLDIDELVEVSRKRYAAPSLDARTVKRWLEIICNHGSTSQHSVVSLHAQERGLADLWAITSTGVAL